MSEAAVEASSLSRRQISAATVIASTSSILLLSTSVFCFIRPDLVLPNAAHDFNSVVRLVGGILLSQAINSIILLVPQRQRQVSSLSREESSSVRYCIAAAVSLAITGLSMVAVSFATTGGCLRIAGALLFLLACTSLMVVFWPIVGVEAERSENDALVQPLLSDGATPGGIAANELDEEDDAEQEGDEEEDRYQLLQETDEEEAVESPSETSHPSTESATSRLRGTRRLLQLAAPQVLYLYVGCLVLLIRLPFSLSIPHFVSTTLSALARGEFTAAKHEILWLLTLGTVDAALDFWCVFLFGYANQRIVRGVRLDLFRKLLRQEVAFFDQHSSGELASRLNSDCSEMAGDLTWFFRFSIESVVRITGITTYMLIRSPLLGACALSIVPVVATINKLYGDWLRRNATAVQDALAQANAVAQEALTNIRTVISFAAEEQEGARYEAKIQRQYQLNIRQLYMSGVYYMAVSTFLINTIVQAALLWIGTILIQRDRLTAEVLLAFMLYQGQLQNETLNLFQSYSSLIKSSGAGDKVFGLLDRKPPPPGTGSSAVVARAASDGSEVACLQQDKSQHEHHVRLRDVTFRYPSRPDHPVLDGLDLEITRGSTVALVGASGCGKTTIINLLQRYYDTLNGSVLIDGIDLRQKDLLSHRRQIAVVTQDPVLFHGSIMENIIYGCPDATAEEAVKAAEWANADTFIRQFPDRYETAVGERGVQLSGGQKQRIAIARAIVKHPSLLLLDEATSALDAESEHVVQEALDRLLHEHHRNMTVVIVAHRLRTVRNADVIAFMQDGRVMEQGTHDELLQNKSGLYHRMVERAGSTGLLPETS